MNLDASSTMAVRPEEAGASLSLSRAPWRGVLLPSEHGGWGLTLEPVLLGLVVAPGWSGFALGLAAGLAFLARTPLKVLLVDARRQRHLPRTRLARQAVAVYAMALAACAAVPLLRAPARCWLPLLLVAPLVAVQLGFDMRSRSRRLLPELAGAVGIAGVAAMIVLADGGAVGVAYAGWILLAARAVTSITAVRDQVAGLHDRPRHPQWVLAGDLGAVAVAATAVVVEPAALAGAVAIVALVAGQRLLRLRPTPRAVILGLTQTAMGLVVVAVAAAGLLGA